MKPNRLEYKQLLSRMVFYRRWTGTWTCGQVKHELHCLRTWDVDPAPYIREAIRLLLPSRSN